MSLILVKNKNNKEVYFLSSTFEKNLFIYQLKNNL